MSQVTASVGSTNKIDTVNIRVYDTAYDQLLYWDFETAGEDPNIYRCYRQWIRTICSKAKPNVIDGYIDGSMAAVDHNPAVWCLLAIKQPGSEPNTIAPDPKAQKWPTATLSVWFRLPITGVTMDRAARKRCSR